MRTPRNIQCSAPTSAGGDCTLPTLHEGPHFDRAAIEKELARLRRIEAAHDAYMRASQRMAALRSEYRRKLYTGDGTNPKAYFMGWLGALGDFDRLVVEEASAIQEEPEVEYPPTRWGPVSVVEQIATESRRDP